MRTQSCMDAGDRRILVEEERMEGRGGEGRGGMERRNHPRDQLLYTCTPEESLCVSVASWPVERSRA